jgi:hypothetical protein
MQPSLEFFFFEFFSFQSFLKLTSPESESEREEGRRDLALLLFFFQPKTF